MHTQSISTQCHNICMDTLVYQERCAASSWCLPTMSSSNQSSLLQSTGPSSSSSQGSSSLSSSPASTRAYLAKMGSANFSMNLLLLSFSSGLPVKELFTS